MRVGDIMSKVVFSLEPDDPIIKFISIMENKHVHEAPVISGKKLVGMVKYSNIVARGGISDPGSQKVKSLMDFKPPSVTPDTNLEDAAKLIFNTGLRAIPVAVKGEVVGIVSVYDIIECCAQMKTFRQTRAENVMSEAKTITSDDDIGKARTIMRENHISRLPVVDSKGEMAGMVAAHDLLRAFKMPKEKMGWYSMAAEMEQINAIPVSTLMNTNPVTTTKDTTLSDIAVLMTDRKVSGITVVEDKKPVGVVTIKDLLEVYVGGLEKNGVYYQIIGLTDEEDHVADTINRMIGDTIQKMSQITPVQFLFVHFKRYSVKGLKIKYSVRVRVMTDKGMFISKAWAWDARDAIRRGLDIVEGSFKKWRDTIRDKSLYNKKKIKDMRE